jgi:hypothetical protein
MRLKLVFTVFVCALVLITSGCARQTAMTAAEPEAAQVLATGIPLAPDFRIVDIPVPAEFDFDRDHSFVFQNSIMDVGRIQYAGKEEIADVAQFYIDEMPRYNWALLSVTEHQTITLIYDKEKKSCVVLLTPKARGTLIQISFFPKLAPPTPEY